MIKIVTDSSVALPTSELERYGITVVPLSVMVDGVVYSDNDLKEPGVFHRLMTGSKHLPKTSQPPVGLFAETYEELAKAGATEIIAIHLAASLSGTIEASRQGALLSGAHVTVVDSETADQALGFQVLKAAQLAQQGASKSEILAAVDEVKSKTDLFIGVSTLENLVKGGRVSRVSGFIGTLLNIRVIMQLKAAHLVPVVKGRGSKTFTRWLAEFASNLSHRQVRQLAVSYSGSPTLAEEIASQLEPIVGTSISIMETASVIQTHTGTGAFAIMVTYD